MYVFGRVYVCVCIHILYGYPLIHVFSSADGHPFWGTCLQTAWSILWGSPGLASMTAEPGQGGLLHLWSMCLKPRHLPAEVQVSGQLDLAETIFCFSVPSRPEIKQEVRFLNEPGTFNVLADSIARYTLYVVITVSWLRAAWDRRFKRGMTVCLNAGWRINTSTCFRESWPVKPSTPSCKSLLTTYFPAITSWFEQNFSSWYADS